MGDRLLRFVARTPNRTVVDQAVTGIRVKTETGQVGIRPGMEPVVLPIDAGLVVIRAEASTTFVGSAGGVLIVDGRTATLLTPLAVVGDDTASVRRAIDAAMAEAPVELAIRKRLGRLEEGVISQLHRAAPRRRTSAGERR
jgi:F0F1-type ATP synthase epsilon subunit